jgi:hypothetical protein
MRIGRPVHIGGRQHRHDAVTLLQFDPAEVDVTRRGNSRAGTPTGVALQR